MLPSQSTPFVSISLLETQREARGSRSAKSGLRRREGSHGEKRFWTWRYGTAPRKRFDPEYCISPPLLLPLSV
jgi:hypothetical protein